MSEIKWTSKKGLPIEFKKIKELPADGIELYFVESYDSQYGRNHKFADLDKTGNMIIINGSTVLNKQLEGRIKGELLKISYLGEESIATGPHKGYTFSDCLVEIAEDTPLKDVSKYEYQADKAKGDENV